MAEVILKCVKRNETGKEAVGRLRKDKMIPGIIYSKSGENTMIAVKDNVYAKFLNENHGNSKIQMEIDDNGKTIKKEVFVKETARRIFKNQILHIDFQEINKGEIIKHKVPIKFVGSPVGVKLGGTLTILRKHILVEFPAENIPWCITLDITDLNTGNVIKNESLELPEGFKLLDRGDLPVVTVVAPRGTSGDEAEGAEGEETAEAAEGEASKAEAAAE